MDPCCSQRGSAACPTATVGHIAVRPVRCQPFQRSRGSISAHGERRRASRLVASASLLERLQSAFTGLRGALPEPNPYAEASREILELVQSGEADRDTFGDLVDVLLEAEVPFREQLIGGGPWVVVYTRGPLLWQQATSPGKVLNSGNQASQEFDPAERTVINQAQLIGDRLFVTASGTYEPLGDGANTPQTLKASIERGALHIFGRQLPLPIRGSGEVDVVYLDDSLRVFRSKGSIAVQIRADLLPGQQ